MNSRTLQDIAQIITGYTFRKSTTLLGPSTHILHARDISSNLFIQHDNLNTITLNHSNLSAVTQSGDIILSARGSFRASVINSSQPIIVSSSTYILRLTSNLIDPVYLAIYLNSTHGQISLSQLSSGSSIRSLLKSDLSNLEIPIPTLSIQKQIANLFQNANNQKQLLEQQIAIINSVSEGTLTQLLNKQEISI